MKKWHSMAILTILLLSIFTKSIYANTFSQRPNLKEMKNDSKMLSYFSSFFNENFKINHYYGLAEYSHTLLLDSIIYRDNRILYLYKGNTEDGSGLLEHSDFILEYACYEWGIDEKCIEGYFVHRIKDLTVLKAPIMLNEKFKANDNLYGKFVDISNNSIDIIYFDNNNKRIEERTFAKNKGLLKYSYPLDDVFDFGYSLFD